MSRAKYQLLPVTDPSPALEVGLSRATANVVNEPTVIQLGGDQPHTSSTMTEISLNDASPNHVDLSNGSSIIEPSGSNSSSSSDHSPTLISTTLPPETELPSYNEAIRLKKMEAYANDLPPSYFDPVNPTDQTGPSVEPINLRFYSDTGNAELQDLSQDIGNNCIFLSAFMIAFFFNWVGFFASICLLPNAAGKYGALSGFGLSMAKWVTIVRYQEWVANMNDFQQKLFFWLFTFLGFYLFFRGLINYMTLKYCPQTSGDRAARRSNRWFAIIE